MSERHKECLRLVYRHQTSKQIGPIVGLSHHTVDKLMKEAMSLTGAGQRSDVALALARYEGEGDQWLVGQSPDLPMAGPLPETAVLEDAAGTIKPDWGVAVDPPSPAAPAASKFGSGHDLSVPAKLGLIVGLAIMAALAFGMLLTGLHSLTEIARGQ